MRMILCDDHEIVILSLKRLFEGRGHEVVATSHEPAELPGLVERHRPDVCVLELVYRNEHDTGDPLRSISACSQLTDVVVVTSDDVGSAGVAAMASGAAAVVSKSTSSDELVNQVVRRSARPRSALKHRGASNYFLTEREFQVLESLADGESTERIASRLGLSHATVRSHVQSLLCKLGVHSRAGAVSVAVRSGLITRCA